jgi:2-polyprenyl-6-methoxyphenol hydroxylase-like FAD-dependent oxidoreductase
MDKVAIVGTGPYGLSVAAHLAEQKIEHRIFGQPIQFWSSIAAAGSARFLNPSPLARRSRRRVRDTLSHILAGREVLRHSSRVPSVNFADYGPWFQQAEFRGSSKSTW